MENGNSVDVWFGVNQIGECYFLNHYSESDFINDSFLYDLYREGPLICTWVDMGDFNATDPGLYRATIKPIFYVERKEPICSWNSVCVELVCVAKHENKNEK